LWGGQVRGGSSQRLFRLRLRLLPGDDQPIELQCLRRRFFLNNCRVDIFELLKLCVWILCGCYGCKQLHGVRGGEVLFGFGELLYGLRRRVVSGNIQPIELHSMRCWQILSDCCFYLRLWQLLCGLVCCVGFFNQVRGVCRGQVLCCGSG